MYNCTDTCSVMVHVHVRVKWVYKNYCEVSQDTVQLFLTVVLIVCIAVDKVQRQSVHTVTIVSPTLNRITGHYNNY